MKTPTITEAYSAGGSGSRPTVVGQPLDRLGVLSSPNGEPIPSAVTPPNLPAKGGTSFAWLLAGASIAVIVVIYFFAFRAAHEAQIKDVPLAPRGARP